MWRQNPSTLEAVQIPRFSSKIHRSFQPICSLRVFQQEILICVQCLEKSMRAARANFLLLLCKIPVCDKILIRIPTGAPLTPESDTEPNGRDKFQDHFRVQLLLN